MTKRRYELYLTDEQYEKLKEKTEEFGFTKKSDYIRFMIFMENSFVEKIDTIHKKICDENVGES